MAKICYVREDRSQRVDTEYGYPYNRCVVERIVVAISLTDEEMELLERERRSRYLEKIFGLATERAVVRNDPREPYIRLVYYLNSKPYNTSNPREIAEETLRTTQEWLIQRKPG